MKQIRTNLKLTQQDLALLLNVSRSTISMYEKGMRGMPAHAIEKWLHMQTLWQDTQQKKRLPYVATEPWIKAQQEQSLAKLDACLQRAAAGKVSLTQQLTRMEQDHHQLVKQLHVLRALINNTSPASRQMKLLRNREELVILRLCKCCPAQRQLINLKLQTLTAQQKGALAGKVILQHG